MRKVNELVVQYMFPGRTPMLKGEVIWGRGGRSHRTIIHKHPETSRRNFMPLPSDFFCPSGMRDDCPFFLSFFVRNVLPAATDRVNNQEHFNFLKKDGSHPRVSQNYPSLGKVSFICHRHLNTLYNI